MFGMVTNVSIPNTSPVKYKQVLVQGVKHTDGITYTRCMEHMEITDESLGLAKTDVHSDRCAFMRTSSYSGRIGPCTGTGLAFGSSSISADPRRFQSCRCDFKTKHLRVGCCLIELHRNLGLAKTKPKAKPVQGPMRPE